MNAKRFIFTLFAPALVGSLALAQTAKPDAAQLRRKQQEARRNAVTLTDTDIKTIAAVRAMPDVCVMKTINGQLTVQNTIRTLRKDEPAEQVRASVAGIPEPLLINDSGEETEIHLTARNFSDERAIAIDTQLDNEGGVLSITRISRFPNASSELSFIQSSAEGEEDGLEPGVVLTYNLHRQRGEMLAESETASASDFAALRRDHADLVNRRLRPLLRDLRLSSAFNVELREAFQAFAMEWRPSEETRIRVAKLVPELDSEKPARRDAALQQLRKLGWEGTLALVHLNRAWLTPEQNARVDVLMAPLAGTTEAQQKRLRRDPQFLCDCLYSDDPRITSSAARQLERLTGIRVEIDLTLSPPRRMDAVEALRDRVLNLIP